MRPIRRSARARRAALALLAAGLLALGGCGDDDDEGTTAGATTAEQPPATTEDTTEATETTETEETERETETEEERESPEDEPGGAGDEEPIRSEARDTGRGGELRPRTIRVPAFIAIGVVLRSGDGADYTLRIGGETLRASGDDRTDEATLEGLRPGRSYRGGGVTIEATAEPGP